MKITFIKKIDKLLKRLFSYEKSSKPNDFPQKKSAENFKNDLYDIEKNKINFTKNPTTKNAETFEINNEIDLGWDDISSKFSKAIETNQIALENQLKKQQEIRKEKEQKKAKELKLKENERLAEIELEQKRQIQKNLKHQELVKKAEKNRIAGLYVKRNKEMIRLLSENLINIDVIEWLKMQPDNFINLHRNKLPYEICALDIDAIKPIKDNYRNLESGIEVRIDLHGYKISQVKPIIQRYIDLSKHTDIILEIIHGFNHGTAIKDFINSSLDAKEIYYRKISIINPGRTTLILKNKEANR